MNFLRIILFFCCALLCGVQGRAQLLESAEPKPRLDKLGSSANALAYAKDLQKQLEAARPQRSEQRYFWETGQALLRQLDYTLRHYRYDARTKKQVADKIKRIELQIQNLQLPSTSRSIELGFVKEGYYADNDHSFQPYGRYLPSQYGNDKKKSHPLLIYLHGYSPYITVASKLKMPEGLEELAEKMQACIALPFGRANTDFQGIGEQDVMRVIARMQERYRIDPDRIILVGVSMGGMGAWTIAGHYAHVFAGALVVSGRGDYFFWHDVKAKDTPAYKRFLINDEFGTGLLPVLRKLPIRSFHGDSDGVVSIKESYHMAMLMAEGKADFKFEVVPKGSHWIHREVFSRADLISWLMKIRRQDIGPSKPSVATRNKIYHDFGPASEVFLSPFALVMAGASIKRFRAEQLAWFHYAKAWPLAYKEKGLSDNLKNTRSLVLVGEPEHSELMRRALIDCPIAIQGTHYLVRGKTYARDKHGLMMCRRSPWNKDRSVLIQSGLAWGEHMGKNHRYDFWPSYVIFTEDRDVTDPDGGNLIVCAGFFDTQGKIMDSMHYERPKESDADIDNAMLGKKQ